jgi:uncharacterized protein YbjT (DUF2867 family)
VGISVVLFGGTGMVGRGVLRECLRSEQVDRVLAIGRTGIGVLDAKLRDLAVPDLFDVSSYEHEFATVDACFFCLGTSAVGMSEAAYRRVTHDLTLAVATAMAHRRPGTTFVYVSGEGTDAAGRAMWARVKGNTEQDLLTLDLNAYMLRPGFIQPVHGERSRTWWYRAVYAVGRPAYPVLRRFAPNMVTSTVQMGQAMLALASGGGSERILDTRAINAISTTAD